MELIATRSSLLARLQAGLALSALAALAPGRQLGLLEIKTSGDLRQEASLEKLEEKGLFTGALEDALAAGRAVVAVHSLKDLPTQLRPGFALAAVLARADPRDVLVSRRGGLMSLPIGARVGTDSSRRREQLALARPDLAIEPVRGNVPTRIAKLDAGHYDALVLAAAGLERLGLQHRVSEFLDPEVCLPAPGQGAIGLETIAGAEWERLAREADDSDTSAAVRAERAFLAGLGGGCQTPVGALATVTGDQIRLRTVVVEGGRAHRFELSGPRRAPELLGEAAARAAIASGVRV